MASVLQSFSTSQRVLVVLAAPLLPLAGCLAHGVATMRQHNPVFSDHTAAMPHPGGLGLAAMITVALVALRMVAAFTPLAHKALPLATRTSAFRVDRFATSIFKVLYFISVSIAGFWVLRVEPWLPRSLGGTGDISASLLAVSQPPSYALRLFMLLELAYQTHSLVFVLCCKPFDGDTMDFVVHDLTGVLLFASAYLANYCAMAATIGFLNDLCDAIQYAFFLATDSRRKAAIAPMYIVLLFGWWYTRLVVFPRECLYAAVVDTHTLDPFVSDWYLQPTLVMLSLLLGLQAYWYVLFADKGLRVLLKASKYDHAAKTTTAVAAKAS